MSWPQTGVTQYHAQLRLPDKGRAIKDLTNIEWLHPEHLSKKEEY